jgi:ATP-dependent DNA ligase
MARDFSFVAGAVNSQTCVFCPPVASARTVPRRLYSRPGSDLTYRFPLIVEALARLRSKSCIIDGEALACDGNGMPTFDRIRYRGHDGSVFLYTFELIELNGDDLRTDPLEIRKATLANVLAKVVGERPSLERGIGQAPSYSQRPIMSCIQKPRL